MTEVALKIPEECNPGDLAIALLVLQQQVDKVHKPGSWIDMSDRVDMSPLTRGDYRVVDGTEGDTMYSWHWAESTNGQLSMHRVVGADAKDPIVTSPKQNADALEIAKRIIDMNLYVTGDTVPRRLAHALVDAHAEIGRLKPDPHDPWTVTDWREWSNEIAQLLPERFDGDESQESLVLQAVEILVKENELQRDVITEFSKATGLMRAEEHPEFLESWKALHKLQAFSQDFDD